ncbi:hypothetical protein HNV12_03395 [Methanococcoides sp. SA1]|nr:hypothetical protein [Methanococcoides sp. SA1]
MKKLFFLLLILSSIIYSLSPSLAAPILEFQHEDTQPGETILATISTPGEFTKQIETSDITFTEGRKQISLETDITFYNGTHYLYIYTTYASNFTIQVENILYKEVDTLQSTTISKEFQVKENPIIINETSNQTATQILSIKPGFIFTTSVPKLKLTNRGTSQLNITYGENETTLESFQSQEITLTPEETFSTTTFSTYKDFQVPIIYPTINASFESPIVTETTDLKSDLTLLFVETYVENSTEETIELFNFADHNITNLEATLDLDFIEIESIEDIPPRGTQNITLTLEPQYANHFQGNINITYLSNETEKLLQIPLSIFVLPQGVTEENFQVRSETCEEIRGQVCESGTICNGTAIFTKSFNPEYCCLDLCVEAGDSTSESSNGFGWLLGIVILIVLVLAGYYFYKKQKQVTPQTTSQQFKQKEETFNKRITGGLTKT